MFPGISFCKIHALMKRSTALVNTSLNEGMAGAILEVNKVSDKETELYFCILIFLETRLIFLGNFSFWVQVFMIDKLKDTKFRKFCQNPRNLILSN